MKVYQSKYPKLTGSSYLELECKARQLHKDIAGRTKRNAYIRSTYFKGDKIFIKVFWEHMSQKSQSDRQRRLQYYRCGIDLLRYTTNEPQVENQATRKGETLYRFMGKSKEGDLFYVQVKQNKQNNIYFMSIFPK